VDLSVVVLSWNTAELTLCALRGAQAAVGALRAEILCVDNASEDDTVARIRRDLPGVELIVNEANLGFAAGNNRALERLAGRVTCFLNSDCDPGPGSLAHVVRWLDRHPQVGIATPRLIGPDGRAQRATRPEPTPLALLNRHTCLRYTPVGRRAARAWRAGPGSPIPVPVDSVTGACLLIRTDLLRTLGGFDEGYPFYWEDVDLCRRARDAGAEVWWVPDGPAVVHAGGASSKNRGGPPRRAFVEGLVRYQRGVLGGRAGRAFAGLLVPGVLARALVEPGRLALGAFARPGRARRRLAAAGAWLRLLERDTGALLRLLRSPR
jgi:GT2 family glycosyltransferase